ncbi:MAG TPA: ATP-binding cassette domain-containing protein [Acidimicrobiales bacterium]|nr:ATP-binding cassette domain-containing protein [Acidimicrobiales bacterium]
MNATTVAVRRLERRFGHTVALGGIDLDLGAGVTGLLGPNGAGKTTLLRILATVSAPDSGTVEVLGHDPASADGRLAIRRRLGYLPQEPGFHRAFSAFEFVDYVAILKEWGDRRLRRDEVRRVLSLVGLEPVMHKRISTLSGGMRRRVGIAQALLGSPDLLILDEPTAGLDPEQRLRFRELLGSQPDATVLLSTHQTDDVAALCHHVVVLTSGLVRFAGAPRELAHLAAGRVWVADHRQAGAGLAWVTADGMVRHVGDPPEGADLVDPTIEDGYLLLTGAVADNAAA